MKLNLLFFASVREVTGQTAMSYSVSDTVKTIDDVRLSLLQEHPDWASVLSGTFPLRVARNQEMVSLQAPVSEGDELAFFPPVTGG